MVDYRAKTATVNCNDTDHEAKDLVAAFEGTRFTATAN